MTEKIHIEDPSAYFKEKKYVIVDSVLAPEICEELTNHLLKLVEERKTTKDAQCPLSEAIYGDPVLDAMLEDLRPTMEKATGLKLIPTYSYARKYAPGDELKPHTDRASCEISATVTLGFKGNVWPIHVSTDDKVENDIGEIYMNPGDMVVYRGMEINHWREPYTQGEWQCQVFLHYVDADGPHKDLKYDKREKLGASVNVKETPVVYNNPKYDAEWYFGIHPNFKYYYTTKDNFLSKPLIDSIVSYGQNRLAPALIGIGDQGVVDKSVRNVEHCWLNCKDFDWLYRMLEEEIRDINWINFKFNLTHMEMVDYLEYHANQNDHDNKELGHGKYEAHVDGSINSTRKLSFSVLLSDPSEFDGGDLLIWTDSGTPQVVKKQQGTITFFPSNALHEVTPVTRGIRRSMVSWIHGPQFT